MKSRMPLYVSGSYCLLNQIYNRKATEKNKEYFIFSKTLFRKGHKKKPPRFIIILKSSSKEVERND